MANSIIVQYANSSGVFARVTRKNLDYKASLRRPKTMDLDHVLLDRD